MPAITVGLVTYNRMNTLPRAVEAIRNQTFTDWELILVNNGSDDPQIARYCRDISQKDKRIRYNEIYPNDRGRAYRMAFEQATGVYYTHIDDDDDCEPDMLEFLYNLAETHQADIALCGSYRVIDGKIMECFAFDEVLVMDKAEALNALMDRRICNTAVWTKLIRYKKVIDWEDVTDTRLEHGGDADAVYKWFAHADKVVAHGIPKYYWYSQTTSNGVKDYIGAHNLSPQLLEDYLQIFADRTAYLQKYVPKVAWRAQCAEWAYMLSMCEQIVSLHKDDCQQKYNYMKEVILTNQEKITQCSCLTTRERNILKDIRHGNM